MFKDIEIKKIVENNFNPRMKYEPFESIKDSDDLLHNIVVREINTNKFEVIAGTSRFKHLKKIGAKKIHCKIMDTNDLESIYLSIQENLERTPLNDIEEGGIFKRLYMIEAGIEDEENMQHFLVTLQNPVVQTICKNLKTNNITEQYLATRIRITILSDDLKEAIIQKKLSIQKANDLTRLYKLNNAENIMQDLYEQYLEHNYDNKTFSKLVTERINQEKIKSEKSAENKIKRVSNEITKIEKQQKSLEKTLESYSIDTINEMISREIIDPEQITIHKFSIEGINALMETIDEKKLDIKDNNRIGHIIKKQGDIEVELDYVQSFVGEFDDDNKYCPYCRRDGVNMKSLQSDIISLNKETIKLQEEQRNLTGIIIILEQHKDRLVNKLNVYIEKSNKIKELKKQIKELGGK